ncbi:MAG: Luciferase-like protein [Mycobacterium sp.]|nr:Luciferase-like protein [Mycobacterium sp.]
MTQRPLKLGVQLLGRSSVPELVEEARSAAAAGFEVILVPDHLGLAGPLVALVAIAQAVPNVQVSNLVLNSSFYRPALLARDLASVDSATGGRLIISLGTGYVEAEFDAAEIPFPSPGARVKIVAEMVNELRRLLSDPGHIPPAVQTPPPIMVAAQGDKMLTLAAQQADIVAIASMGSEADLAGRVAFVKEKAAGRFDDIELQFAFIQVSMDDPSDLTLLRMLAPPDAPEEELRKLTTVLDGSLSAAVERIQRLHAELGISYFTFSKTPGTSWATFEKLVAALR